MEYLTQRQAPKTKFLSLCKCRTLTRWLWSRWQVLRLFMRMLLIVKGHMVGSKTGNMGITSVLSPSKQRRSDTKSSTARVQAQERRFRVRMVIHSTNTDFNTF